MLHVEKKTSESKKQKTDPQQDIGEVPQEGRGEGIDFEESFAPVAAWKCSDFRSGPPAQGSLPIYQMDVEKMAFLMVDEERFTLAPSEGFVDPDHPRKKSLPSKGKLWYGFKGKLQRASISDADHADALILGKALLEGYISLVPNCKAGCQRKTKLHCMSSAEAEYVALSASCAQVMWLMDTASRFWLQLPTKYVVL
ncbi:hypothetical protein Tco_0451048 [Tanacetum coccineum]